MSMEQTTRHIYNLISDTIGLKVDLIPDDVWERLLKGRMALTGCLNLAAYDKLLSSSPFEVQELVERLVVPETWFFRDPVAFDLCVNYFNNCASPGIEILRLLSVPCSTGE